MRTFSRSSSPRPIVSQYTVVAFGLLALILALAPNANATVGTCETLPGGVIEVEGTGGAAAQPTGYATLQAAFNAINIGDHTGGTISIDVCGNTTEVGTATLNASGGSAAYAAVSILPVGGAWTISGGIAGVLVDLNGADAVTIDGLNTGGNSLTIDNTSTNIAASTIQFRADASNNTVQNATIKGASTSLTTGTIVFGAGTTTGNLGNVINANTITASGANLPTVAIYSAGLSTTVFNTTSVTNNNIQDWFNSATASNGILVASNSSAWTITGNRFFQTATRTSTASASNNHRAIQIVTASGSGYTINSNIIGFATAGGTGTMTYAGAFTNRFFGIELTAANSPVSDIQGNTVTAISLTTSTGAANVFAGINVLGGGVNVGTTTLNVIGGTTGTGAINVTSSTTLATIVGINVVSTGTSVVQNNQVGSINTGGGATIGYTITGISTSGAAGNITITGNTIGSTSTANSIAAGTSGTTTTGVCTFIGISNSATGTISITGNTVQNASAFGTGASVWTGITNTGGTGTLNITTNSILNGTDSGTGLLTGIQNTAAAATVNINSNVLRNHSRTVSATGAVTGITNTGAVTSALNINLNQLGDGTGGFVNYAVANSSALIGINSTGTTTAALSISNNNFQGITYSAAGTNSNTYITYGNATSAAANINNNTFTNLSVNTSGSVTFITRSGNMTATGSENVNNNSIVTAFAKGASGGTVTFFGANASSVNGSTMTNNLNNFSNVTVPGSTIIAGWSNTEGASSTSGPTKTITNNTFNNLVNNTTPTGAITGMNINFSGASSVVSTNTVSNVTAGGAFIGISLGSSNQSLTCTQNIVDPITSLGTSASGIAVATSPAVVTVTKNKIYDITGTNAAALVNGILVSGSATSSTVTLSNNLIGDLKATLVSGTDAIRGISITATGTTSTVNVLHNTVYLSAPVSGGANFGTSGIFHTTSTTATTSALNLRNNIIVNNSAHNGTGLTVAYRRSSGAANALANYASTSNNNDFYANTPGAADLIYSDGTSTAQTFNQYKNGVFTAGTIAPRDSASITENPNFLSTTGSSATFLHINTGTPTQLESGGGTGTGIGDDFDGEVRFGFGGYAGTGTAPDIGADEFNGTALDLTPPAISYTALGNAPVAPDRSFSPVTVTDATGVEGTAGTRPRVYYKKSSDAANTVNDNTCATAGWKYVEASGGTSPFSFTIDYSLLSGCAGVSVGDSIQYFVVAQDTVTPTPNVAINSGIFAATPTSVALTAAAFPITGTINSYLIAASISGSKTICPALCDYDSITNAGGLFEAINNSIVSGNLTVTMTGDSTGELGTNALNQWVESGAGNYTLTIQPDSATIRTISGAVANGLIRYNGADRVTFDGRFGGAGQFLRIRNTNTSNPGITFLNDATFNTFESCIIEGGNTSTTSGTVLFSTSTGTLGNSNNTFHLCDIRDRSDAAGVPANAVFNSGSIGAPNATNTISGCNIYNWTTAGVNLSSTGTGNGWVINPSSFYQTAARTAASTAILIAGGGGHSVLNNSIGGTAPGATGANWATSSTFNGISLAVAASPVTSVQGNVVKNIRSTSTSFTASNGIVLTAGGANIGTVSGNTIGSSNVAERFEFNGDSFGINVTSATACTVANNTVNNMTTAPNVPTGEFYFGISVAGAGNHVVTNNTVTNFTNSSIPDASFNTQTIGMLIGPSSGTTGVITVRGNTISNVGSTGATAPSLNNRVWGLIISGTAAGTVVENNKISNIFASSSGAGARVDVVTCLQSQNLASATYANNVVTTDGGSGGTSDRAIFGILDLSATPSVSTYYFNSVSIRGTATGASNTYAFNRNSTATMTIKDNIFADTRTGGTGFHVAMANTNAASTGWPLTASDYNFLWNVTSAHATQWLGAAAGNNLDLAGFKAATSGDNNTLYANPLFLSATDLRPGAGSTAIRSGTNIPAYPADIDGVIRHATTPSRGAYEAVSDLQVTQTDAPDPVAVGSNVTYTMTVTNNGPSAAANPVLSVTIPAFTTFVSVTPAAGWTCTAPVAGSFTCSATSGSMASGGSVVFSLVVNASYCSGGGVVNNVASIGSALTDDVAGSGIL